MNMQRHRFYAPLAQFTQYTVTLDSDESHHLSRVLRIGEGAQVFVFDGRGNEWECEVSRLSKTAVELNLIRRLDDVVESALNLTLAQALIKGDKLDWVVQKATELGVTRVAPESAPASAWSAGAESQTKPSSNAAGEPWSRSQNRPTSRISAEIWPGRTI
jgi:RsmE family RNA methyltransferase